MRIIKKSLIRLRLSLTGHKEQSSGAALLMEMGTGNSLCGAAVIGIPLRFSLISRALPLPLEHPGCPGRRIAAICR